MPRKRHSLKVLHAAEAAYSEIGRNSKFNEGTITTLVAAFRDGCNIQDACHVARISTSIYHHWMRDAEARPEESPYRLLPELVNNAIAWGRRKALQQINKAGDRHWQAAAWRLEHTTQGAYPSHKAVEITGKDGGPVQLEVVQKAVEALKSKVEGLSDEDLDKVLEGEE